jgi:hypothetical protein
MHENDCLHAAIMRKWLQAGASWHYAGNYASLRAWRSNTLQQKPVTCFPCADDETRWYVKQYGNSE